MAHRYPRPQYFDIVEPTLPDGVPLAVAEPVEVV